MPRSLVNSKIVTKRDRSLSGLSFFLVIAMMILQLLSIPYYELIFRCATAKSFTVFSLLVSFLLAFGLGGILFSFCPDPACKRVHRIVFRCFLLALSVLYSVNYLIYRSFKVFYDINTVTNGAKGVVNGFMGDAIRLATDKEGLLTIGFFLFPLVISFVIPTLQRKLESGFRTNRGVFLAALKNRKKRLYVGTGMISILFGLWLVLLSAALSSFWTVEYNYQTIVEEVGLMPGLLRDAYELITNDPNDLGFVTEEKLGLTQEENVETDLESTTMGSGETEALQEEYADLAATNSEDTCEDQTEPQEPKEYGFNCFDLDYEALAETTSGVNRELDLYVAGLEPSRQNEYTGLFKGKNLIMITAEAFSGDMIDPVLTPTLYRMSEKGIRFTDYYQPAIAGTTGGEYTNLFGLMPTSGGKSMSTLTSGYPFLNMGHQLSSSEYYGWAFHDNSIYVYDRNVTHEKLGYSEGFMGLENGMKEMLTTSGFPASDREMMEGTLPLYIDHAPFNVYYMTVSGHGQYGRSINQMSSKNYHRVEDLDHSDMVKCYLANNLELEDALNYILGELEKRGIADDTVICVGADHFPYSLDKDAALGNMPNLSELYGYPVTNYLERDHNRLILWCGMLEKQEPITVDVPVSSLDILPTLSNLFGVEFDSRLLPGRDVFSDAEALVFDGGYDWKTELGTYIASKNSFTPTDSETEIPEGYVDRIKQIVRNKYSFCKGVLQNDYYGHIYDALSGQ